MIRIPYPKDFDKEKAIQTWMPIIESKFNIEDPKVRELACLYAHSHAQVESAISPGETSSSLLPMALLILSKLNLSGKNVQLSMGPTGVGINEATEQTVFIEVPTFRVATTFSAEAYMDDRTNIVSIVEEMLINKMVDAINMNLRRYDTLVIYLLVSSVMTITEESTMRPKMGLMSRICFLERNSTPEQLYHVSEDSGVYSVSRVDLNNAIITKDAEGNEYAIDLEDNHAVKVIPEVALMNLAEEIDRKSEALKESANRIRRSILE